MKNNLEQFIRNNQEEFDKATPSPVVLDKILKNMRVKPEVKSKGIIISFKAMNWAAAAILLFTCGITVWLLQTSHHKDNSVKINIPAINPVKKSLDSITPIAKVPEVTKKVEPESMDVIDQDLNQQRHVIMAKLKAKTLRSEKAVIFAGLNNMESPARRINFTYEADKLENKNNDIVDALVSTLNNDPNANVRLAALDALARFYKESYVRKKLVTSLKKQQDPVVQIALINLLTRMREAEILTELDKLINDEKIQKPVKDCAYSGIMQLRS